MDVLWLAPEPSEPFVELTQAAGAAFPDDQPQGGQFSGTSPQLTLTDRAPIAEMLTVEQNVELVLPNEAVAGAVTLMAEQSSGAWHRKASFQLRHRGSPEDG